jgi:hypothetical protein
MSETVLFVTKKPTYEIVVEPEDQIEVHGRLITKKGRKITFSIDGEYETSDPDEIKLIRSKHGFGCDIHEINKAEREEIKQIEQNLGMTPMSDITTAMECPYCSRKFISKQKIDQHMLACPKKNG